MPLESPQAVRDRLDAVTSKLLDGEISTNVAETARKLLATAADTFKAEANTALAPVAPQAPTVSGAAPGGATFNITFATTPHGPVFEAASEPAPVPAPPAPPLPAPRAFNHPQPAPPQIVDVEPQAPRPPAPPSKQKQERQQATALLLARHRRK